MKIYNLIIVLFNYRKLISHMFQKTFSYLEVFLFDEQQQQTNFKLRKRNCAFHSEQEFLQFFSTFEQ